MSLKEYDKKRDFTKTKEPKGKLKSDSSDGLIFVVQKHKASRLHFDFRLEWNGVLLSWAVPKGPSYNTKDKRLAVEVEPHPYDYKDFEGTIPKGEYGGGTVMLWDEGTWEPQDGEDFEKGLKDGSLKIILHGERLKGKWALVRMKDSKEEKQNNWLLIKEKDGLELDNDGISDFDTSVRSNKSMDEITSGEDFKEYNVQLATLSKNFPKGKNWIYELKYDGYRIIAYVDNGNVKLMTRNHQDYTKHFPEIKKSLEKIKDKLIIDGEIIVTKNGVSDFQSLQKYIKEKKGTKPVFMVFDLLYYGGKDIKDETLKYRREKLSEFLENNDLKYVNFSSDVKGDPEEILDTICKSKMEGLICKKEDKPYIEGRNRDWLKIKCENRQEFIVLGYTETESKVRAFSSLLLGVVENGEIIYAGRVGTGFSEKSSKDILKKLKPLVRKSPPLNDPPKERSNEKITWTRPDLVAEVTFAQWTEDGLLRQPSFKGIRLDKSFKEVENEVKRDLVEESNDEEISEEKPSVVVKKKKKKSTKSDEVVLSSPDKEIFKDYTKQDLYDYYNKVYEKMYPYIENRFSSLVRCPNGYKEECFYQKNIDDNFKFLKSNEVKLKEGDISDYIYIDSIEGLKEAVQYSTIEFHIWGSQIDNIDKPDILVFDLDPDENMELEQVKEGVIDLKEILDALDLESFLKTSGNKGYHVVVPLKPNGDFKDCKAFAKNVALAMEQKWPKKYTANMSKEKRKGKIYIDWVRNSKGATSVAPYSVRSKDTPYVSMPISWEELENTSPKDYNIDNVLENLEDNPWEDFFKTDQKINKS